MHRSGPCRDPHVDHSEIVDRSDNGPVDAVDGVVGGALPVTRARSGAGVVVGSRLSRCSETHRGDGGLIVVGGAGVRRLFGRVRAAAPSTDHARCERDEGQDDDRTELGQPATRRSRPECGEPFGIGAFGSCRVPASTLLSVTGSMPS